LISTPSCKNDPPSLKWLFVGFDGSRCEEEAAMQEVELGAAIRRHVGVAEPFDLLR
jgi:hypothetical protein